MARIIGLILACVVVMAYGAVAILFEKFERDPGIIYRDQNLLGVMKEYSLEECLGTCAWNTTCHGVSFLNDATCKMFKNNSFKTSTGAEGVKSYMKVMVWGKCKCTIDWKYLTPKLEGMLW